MKITVPDSLADISVKQYKKLALIDTEQSHDKWLIEAISIFCDLSTEQVEQMNYKDLSKISRIVKKLNDADGQGS